MVEFDDEFIEQMLKDPIVQKMLDDPEINQYKMLANEIGVELISIEEALKGDALVEFIKSARRILNGVAKMGVRVYELSIPSMMTTILSVMAMGPEQCRSFAKMMSKELKKIKE